MALIWRLLQLVGGFCLRAALLFFVLFVAYLVATEVWPTYRQLTSVAAERPALEQEAMRLRSELSRRERRVAQVRAQLSELVAGELQSLRLNVESFQAALADVEVRRHKLEQDLTEAVQRETEYCTSWNPLKRWVCAEVRERTQSLRANVGPLLEELERSRQTLTEEVSAASDALRRYELLPPEERGSTADALRLRAELAEQSFEIHGGEQALVQLEARLKQAQWAEASPWVWVSRQLRAVALPLSLIVVSVLLAPWLHRVLFYFVVMPLVQRARPLRLTGASAGTLIAGESGRVVKLTVHPGEQCHARAGYVRPVAGTTRSVWLYDWRAPFVSYASGLSVLTRVDGPTTPDAGVVETTLASPSHAESHLLELRLENHPGFVFHPRHLVAVTGDVTIRTLWRVFSLHAWMTGQLRFIVVEGSGRCIFEGFGDIAAQSVGVLPSRIEQELVVGFDARLQYSTARTETFLPYLLGRTPLVDDVFSGSGVYLWQKNTRPGPTSLAERGFELVFGALGKLLGF